MRTLTLIFLSLLFSGHLFSQGSYLKENDPVVNLWMLKPLAEGETPPENEEGSGDPGAPLVGDVGQQFFFLVGGESEENMMAVFMEPGMGFACPTYFKIKGDKKFLYLEILNSCILDLPAEEKKVKVEYKLNGKGDELTLIFKGNSYVYIPWDGK